MFAFVKVRSKNVGIFIDRPILNNRALTCADLVNLVKSTVQKINLKVKGPPCHVFVKIFQVWIVVNGFIKRSPSIML